MRAFGKTNVLTIGSLCLVGDHIVVERGNLFLSLNGRATYGTLDTVGKTGFGTGCCLTCNSLLGMRSYGNNLSLSADLVTTLRALNYEVVGAFLSTGCFYSLFLNRICCGMLGTKLYFTNVANEVAVLVLVTKRVNYFLLYGNYAADGTFLTLGKTVFGTGCVLTRNSLLGVTESINFFLRYENLAAHGALLTLGKT